MREKARASLWLKSVSDEVLTKEKEKEGRTAKQSNHRGKGEKNLKQKALVE